VIYIKRSCKQPAKEVSVFFRTPVQFIISLCIACKFFFKETLTAYRYVMLILTSFLDICDLLDLQTLTTINGRY
jgi:hypothetical protein